ncbi:hypothetical protein A2291_06890 [candidate division WOR-1 bacterium RIFOXYB2_FULL_42_35]|uniref:Uncharacterized protein n=1 Tax=candidate division WOR-1 bacterium RIFOXYC2_FULL_41_25 TaxID=1802586 RepID=A0A1F4TQ43_UNCSA|nr:MAG: hypothetical protein A2291_06890 [candidate division WOR-1 bacterium RIFOXYB2_FULL_42_35]OGC24604.1 MAG: hypothetical protein A2247_06670 [candidate division WOR-1 bacterium RIFOXYA2_FULL_41_14]OGC34650.1 MAG: hypothetical protein A2462_04905 [candidate division WOR-1 bacterium RIFOXYC2_FULL_41_25]OGC41599.1 MAG: hypothetical protein A2548_01220 [candidate division WOR-1 bacterium RIFOXYD2_FULL_41_8]
MKRILCWLLLISLLGLPVAARSLFYDETEDTAVTATPLAATNYTMKVFQLKYINAEVLAKALTGVLAVGEGVSVNEKLNTIVVRASTSNLMNTSKIVAQLDQPPLQVQVEAKIIELKSGNGDATNPDSLGMSWKYTHPTNVNDYIQSTTTSTLTTAASSLGLYAQLISGNTAAYLQGLKKTVGYNLVAAPWITALNHEPAEILIGSKYGYSTAIISQTSTVQEVKYLEVGTKLKFTPHINEDGYIIMDVYPSISEGSVVGGLPQENTTETKNKVLVKDGQSIVIGGLSKTYNNEVELGVPILSSLPFIGMLFKSTQIIKEKRDLMVIITPHIVTPEFLTEMADKAQAMEDKTLKQAEEADIIR